MPVIHVNVWEGFGPERSKIVIHHVTKIFEELNVPRDAVEVIIHEVPKSHWGVGGVPASDK
ncbi:MAG: tautomerase family protein [Candidatus Krumholzibacteria bacterium]|nr:tautomerase family protein [Candidatus Krumholzibacteria bacterium]